MNPGLQDDLLRTRAASADMDDWPQRYHRCPTAMEGGELTAKEGKLGLRGGGSLSGPLAKQEREIRLHQGLDIGTPSTCRVWP
jgi:hypothetical protein